MCHLAVRDLDLVPHDLWAGASLPASNFAEALSLVLIQFDLTFAWATGEGGMPAGIRIVRAPASAVIERNYVPRRATAENAAREWRAAIPGLDARAAGRHVIVRGTAEQHDAVDGLLNPRAARPANLEPAAEPLSKRKFDLRYRGRADALVGALRKSGIDVQYDANRLAAAKVDLSAVVELDVKNATLDQILRAICDPLGLKFSIGERSVTLEPK
jgi:hypothetical protein